MLNQGHDLFKGTLARWAYSVPKLLRDGDDMLHVDAILLRNTHVHLPLVG